MPKININEILDRIKLIFNAKSDIELSKKLGKSDTYIGQCRKRNSIDFELIMEKLYDYNIDWLVTGIDDRKAKTIKKDGDFTGIVITGANEGKQSFEDLNNIIREKDCMLRETQKQLFELQKLLSEYQLRDKQN